MPKLKVGVIGTGALGRHHARLYAQSPNAEMIGIFDVQHEAAQKVGEEFGLKVFEKWEDLAAECDALSVAVPANYHAQTTIPLLEMGKHVLVEKPVSVQKKTALQLLDAVKKHPELKVAAMFNQRTLPAHIKIKKLLESGELGKIRRICWTITNWFRTQAYYDSGDWRATWGGEGGGVLLNQCPHQLDLWQWICGMPVKVQSHLHYGKWHDIEVEDDVTAYFEYPDGMTATFITSTGEAPGTNRLEISCERGRVVLENNKITFNRTEMPVSEFRSTTDTLFGAPPCWNIDVPIPGDSLNGMYHKEVLRRFGEAILNGGELVAHGEEGLNSVELANAMLYSFSAAILLVISSVSSDRRGSSYWR